MDRRAPGHRVSVTGGNRYVLVDADQWAKRPAFDHALVAAALSSATGESCSEITLPFPSITLVQDGTAIEGGADHSHGLNEPYFVRRRWDFFVRHLLGVERCPGRQEPAGRRRVRDIVLLLPPSDCRVPGRAPTFACVT